ncbi:gmp synthase [Grosmannia clavigera kw1407]|uniref:GMP synthase [glutamine-hydrolyzing] n=1 Tax=Grosmannia clavigera (strain kw1407 / UAMH 11150) TaxID=655863 RepID=F0XTW3_GROCL|nr:gmp synthase [Grosmannia clavigera kw1407]EFW98701.1 gmp synthase [Grosmannia clavigera kw1407]
MAAKTGAAAAPHEIFDTILLLDFGSQTSHLILRGLRSLNVFCEIMPCTTKIKDLTWKPKGIILSGSPASVTDAGAPHVDPAIFDLGVPILGICYGCQELSWREVSDSVAPGKAREYGHTDLTIFKVDGPDHSNKLFEGLGESMHVYMSHDDKLIKLPNNYAVIASSQNSEYAGIVHKTKPIYGIQFHPEVEHTPRGIDLLKNFAVSICKAQQHWVMSDFIEHAIASIRERVGDKAQVIGAVSGGVDSTVVARLMKEAIGDRFHAVLVDNGVMRLNECADVKKALQEHLGINLTIIDGGALFLGRLKGVTEPETKRKIIGGTFIDLFEEEAIRIEKAAENTANAGKVEFFVQGTLYPDVIESLSLNTNNTVKTHHNVGGLPARMMNGQGLKLIEPLRELFKDEVRAFGRKLGIPDDLVMRHPFPGPGIAIRIIGEVTPERVEIARKADHIFISMIKEAGIYDKIAQAYAGLDSNRAVGVMGDARVYGYIIILRAVMSTNFMTAEPYPFDFSFLTQVSRRIINEVPGVARVTYDITSKPPESPESSGYLTRTRQRHPIPLTLPLIQQCILCYGRTCKHAESPFPVLCFLGPPTSTLQLADMDGGQKDVIVPSLETVSEVLANVVTTAKAEAAKGPGSTYRRPNLVPVYGQISSDLITPSAAYLKVSAHSGSKHSFLFESAATERVGRYSFLAAGPRKVLETGPGFGEACDPLPGLEVELSRFVVAHVPGLQLPPLAGGAVGYVSYDCVRYFEPKTARPLKDVLKIPESQFCFYDTIVAFDRFFGIIKVITYLQLDAVAQDSTTGTYEAAAVAAEYRRATGVIRALIDVLNGPTIPLPEQKEVVLGREYTSNVGQAGYMSHVARLKKHIEAGDIIQAVPSQRFARPTDLHPFNVYRHLRTVNPSPYLFYIDCGGRPQIVGASPELLVKTEGGRVVTHPIAGTVKRGRTPEEDTALAEELRQSLKDRAEHVMLCDLARNDVTRVCDPRETRVDRLMVVEKFSHVQHLVSQVSGVLRPGCSRFDAFRSIFPAGTVSGAPKVRAMELIAELEGEKRGVYAGAVGYFGYNGVAADGVTPVDGQMDTCIALRTMVLADGVAYLQAGGGIVFDSDEYDEWVETMNKLGANMHCITSAEQLYARRQQGE